MTERDELRAEDRARPHAADRHRHPVSALGVEPRLRPESVGEYFDRLRRARSAGASSCGRPRHDASAPRDISSALTGRSKPTETVIVCPSSTGTRSCAR